MVLFEDHVEVVCCSDVVVSVALDVSHVIESFAEEGSSWLLMKLEHVVFKVFYLLEEMGLDLACIERSVIYRHGHSRE